VTPHGPLSVFRRASGFGLQIARRRLAAKVLPPLGREVVHPTPLLQEPLSKKGLQPGGILPRQLDVFPIPAGT